MTDEITNTMMRDDLEEKNEEIKTFISEGGIVCTFLMGQRLNNYKWYPYSFNIVSKTGEEIIPQDTAFKKIFKKYDFNWFAHFKYIEDDDIVLAENLFNFPVSLIREKRKGKIIFFPMYGFSKDVSKLLLRDVIEVIKSEYLVKRGARSISPTWLEKYLLPNEKDIKLEIENKQKVVVEYNTIRQILYETGDALVDSVRFLFEKFGFKAIDKEKEGAQDIELKHGDFFAYLEVKGKKKDANQKDYRQLLDWVVSAESDNGSLEIKPIFVVNHYRDKDIKERGAPFTDGALKRGEKNDFCFITTVTLFEMYKKFLGKELDIEGIKEILSRIGLVRL